MAHLSFRSLYSLVVSYDLMTAWKEVNSLGEFLTREVKINSNLACWYLVLRYKAKALPLMAELVSLISVFKMQSKPTERLVF